MKLACDCGTCPKDKDRCDFECITLKTNDEPKEVRITVPLVPPSVNHYVKHTRKGHRYVTSEAKAFKEAVGICAAGHQIRAKEYAVGLAIYLGHGDKGDIDNFPKCVLDGLVQAQVIHSDAAITELTTRKMRDRENPRTEIVVRAL